MHINIAWQDVDTVLLDMDGTLLDLAFDNYFWQKLVPETWGAKNGVTPQEAMEYMRQQYHDVQHTLNWYCLDYWSEQLGLDICAMTTEMGPRAVLREDTIPFLEALKASGKQRILLTNGTIEARISGVHAGDIATFVVGGLDHCNDLFQMQLGTVDDEFGLMPLQHCFRNQRASINNHRATADQALAFDGNQLWIARPGTDEIDSHGSLLKGS